MDTNIKKKYNFFDLAIFFFPISFLFGSAFVEINLFLINFFFLIKLFKEYKTYKFNKNFLLIFLIFIFFSILSSLINAKYTWISFGKSIAYIRFFLFFFAIDYFIKNNPHQLKKLFIIIFFSLLFVACSGWLHYFDTNNIIFIKSNYNERISGIFGQELILGSYILSFYFFLLLMVHKLGIKFNLIYFISFFILFSAIIISNERMSIIKLTTLSLLILFFQIGIKNFKKTLLIYLFCISVMFFFISSDEQRLRPWKKFIFYLASNIESVTNKNLLISDNKFIFLKNNVVFYDYFSLINTGIHISHTYFPLGTGVRNFRHECKSEQYKNKMLFSCGNHPHNVYVEILAEVGFVGLIFFMIFIYIIFKKIIKNKKISRIEKVIMIAMLLSFFWPIATTGSFYNNFFAALIWFNLGVVNSLSTSDSI